MGPLMYILGGFAALVGFVTVAGSSGDAALSKEFAWQFRLAARLRTPVLMFIVVPLSFFRWLRTTLKSKWLRLTRTADPAVAQAAPCAPPLQPAGGAAGVPAGVARRRSASGPNAAPRSDSPPATRWATCSS